MIEKASKLDTDISWIIRDASENLSDLGKFDLVFSNAAIQWIPNQQSLLKNLFSIINNNGGLAVQIPNVSTMAITKAIYDVLQKSEWSRLSVPAIYDSVKDLSFYYDILSQFSDEITCGKLITSMY